MHYGLEWNDEPEPLEWNFPKRMTTYVASSLLEELNFRDWENDLVPWNFKKITWEQLRDPEIRQAIITIIPKIDVGKLRKVAMQNSADNKYRDPNTGQLTATVDLETGKAIPVGFLNPEREEDMAEGKRNKERLTETENKLEELEADKKKHEAEYKVLTEAEKTVAENEKKLEEEEKKLEEEEPEIEEPVTDEETEGGEEETTKGGNAGSLDIEEEGEEPVSEEEDRGVAKGREVEPLDIEEEEEEPTEGEEEEEEEEEPTEGEEEEEEEIVQEPEPVIQEPEPEKKSIAEPTTATEKHIMERDGSVAWRQGEKYKLIYPPYGQNNIITSSGPFLGMVVYNNARSAYRALLEKHRGQLPPTVVRDMGITEMKVSSGNQGMPQKKRMNSHSVITEM